MCEPITATQLAIAAGGMDLIGSQVAVNQQNQASLNNAANARSGAADQQDQEMVDEGAKLGTTENAPKDADKLVPLSDPSLD
jgi:hypothetical protein